MSVCLNDKVQHGSIFLQVIIDSQPLTVAVLAALLFGESIGFVGATGLVLGVIGLLLLEVLFCSNARHLLFPIKVCAHKSLLVSLCF